MQPILSNYDAALYEWPKSTRVELIEDDEGFYLRREGTREVLDITFKRPTEALHYATSEYWLLTFMDALQNLQGALK